MTRNALARVRRFQQQEPTLRILAFQLRHHWFCLPLALARRVLPKEGAILRSVEVGLIQLQNEAIPIVDAASLVYGSSQQPLLGQVASPTLPQPMQPQLPEQVVPRTPSHQMQQQSPGQIVPRTSPNPNIAAPAQNLLITDLSQGGAIGMIIDGTPAIKRVRQSAFKPVPSMYLAIQRMRGISSMIDLGPSTTDNANQPIFLLEIESLLPQNEF